MPRWPTRSKAEETPAAESAPAQAVPSDVQLSEGQILRELEGTRLPVPSKVRLSLGRYASTVELGAAIDAEIAYVKELTGSGQPQFMQMAGAVPAQTVVAAVAKRNVAAINTRYFGH